MLKRMLKRLLPLVLLFAGCASSPPASTPPSTPTSTQKKQSSPPKTTPATVVDDAAPPPPKTFAAALEQNASTCPVPFFTLQNSETVTVGAHSFTLQGSTLTRQGGAWTGPLKIGVLGAIKDAEPETRENLEVAAAAFKKAGVHFVVANGDLTGNETSAIVPVVQMIGEEIELPVFAHSGNYEWTSKLTEAFAASAAQAPHLFNLNVVRDVDLGGVHLLSLPGYFNRRFLQSGACHYDEDDVVELTAHAKALRQKGDVVVLTSHGPPLGTTPTALDVTSDGPNVGDPQLNTLLNDADVRFGVFSHILEAGGRAVTDVGGTAAVKLPMKGPAQRLYVNAGSASSFGWGMLNGKTARGMAAIVTIDGIAAGNADAAVARVEFVTLR